MKKVVILSVITFLLQAAHSLRGGDMGTLAMWIILPFFFIQKETWMRPVLSLALLAASANWIATGALIILARMDAGAPWLRLGLIVAAAAGISLLSALLLLGKKSQEYFSSKPAHALQQSVIFIVTFVILELLRTRVPVTLILADRFIPGSGRLEIFFISWYAAWMGGKMLDPELTARYRPVLWTLFSAVFFLQLILGLAGLEKFLMTGKLHLPIPALIISGPLYRLSGLFMPILFLSTVILAGPAWCSHLCYIGSWDDLSSRLCRERMRPLPGWTRKARVAVLIAAVAVPLTLRLFDAVSDIALVIASLFGIGGIMVMLLVSRKRRVMAHCTAWCPVGLAAVTLGKISPWRLSIGKECNQCMLCSRSCRYGALSKDDLLRGKPGMNCTLCGDCVPSCKNSHIAYSFAGRTSGAARTAFLTTLIIIHAVFLAVARI